MPESTCAGGREAARQKREEGEPLTADEEQLLDEGAADPCPTPFGMRAEGPLSPCDVDYCRKCHRLGHAGGVVLLAVAAFVLATRLTTAQLAGIIGVAGILQASVIAFLGYYPIFGPILGVALKPILPASLKRDVRLSDYLPFMSTPDPSPDEDESTNDSSRIRDAIPFFSSTVDEETVFPDDANENDKIQTLKQKLREEKGEKKELRQKLKRLKNEKKEKERAVNQRDQEKSRVAEEKQELQAEKEQLEEKLQFFSHYRRNPANANATPADVKNEHGVKKQGYWVLDWFKMDLRRPHCRGRFWFAVVITEEELKRGDYNEAPDLMDEDEARQRYGEKIWPKMPAADAPEEEWVTFNPPQFLDADRNNIPERTREIVDEDGNTKGTHTVKEFDEAAPQLFEERIDDVREALANGELAKLTILYDESGTYRGPDYDASSFKTRSEWREKARGWKKRTEEFQSQVSMMQDDIDDMQHEIRLREQEVDEKERRLERLRTKLEDISRANRAQEHTNRQLEERYERATAEVSEIEQQLETADEQRQRAQREKLRASSNGDMDEVSAELDTDVRKAQEAALSIMEMYGYSGNGKDLDLAAIRDGRGETSRSEAISHFMDDDAVPTEQKDKIRDVIDGSVDRITREEV